MSTEYNMANLINSNKTKFVFVNNSVLVNSVPPTFLVVRASGYRYRGPGFDPRRYQIF